MRLDFCKMTSSTGGTSTLTCSAQTGYPLVSEAFTGTRLIDYSIAEYTSSAKTQLSKAETGIGSYNTSTEVLTRTKVLSTWDATDYRPLFGNATAPTALNFGTTSANIDIMVSPMAGGIRTPIPFMYGAVASVSDGLGPVQGNFGSVGSTNILSSGMVYYIPYEVNYSGFVSQFSFRTTAALTGGSPTADCAIYEVASDGTPGKRLVNFTQIGSIQTTNTTYTSTALATPIFLVPGWYWVAFLYVANSATGAFTPRTAFISGGSPVGTLFANTNATQSLTLGSQTALNDPATAPTGTANSSVPAIVFK